MPTARTPHASLSLCLMVAGFAACNPQGVDLGGAPDRGPLIDLDALPDAAPEPDAERADAFLAFLDVGPPLPVPDAAPPLPVPDAALGPACDEPVPEVCNGLDDDCDRRVDEGRIIGTGCVARRDDCLVDSARICNAEALPFCPDVETLTCRETPLVFAMVSDYGGNTRGEGVVADLIRTFEAAFVVTAGDNNMPAGAADTIDRNVGQYFGEFIGAYTGGFGGGSDDNRFWPALGDADWLTENAQPHLDFFTLPGNERYYDVDLGVVHLFVLSSDAREPDGNTWESVQGQWFQAAVARSTACLKVAVFHHPPYSSSWRGEEGGGAPMRWPFAMAGIDAVVSGQDRIYERLSIEGVPYFIIGLSGGARTHTFADTPRPESQFRYRDRAGALRVTVSASEAAFAFVNVDGTVVDTQTVPLRCGM